jgi:thiol:disulfide interchange protein DsbD
MLRSNLLFIALLAAGVAARAGGPVTWSFGASTHADGRPELVLKASCEEGWHIYAMSLSRDDGPIPTSVRVDPSEGYLTGEVIGPVPEIAYDPNFGMELSFHSGEAVFTIPLQRQMDGALTVTGAVEFMACNDKTCLPPREVPFSVNVPAP